MHLTMSYTEERLLRSPTCNTPTKQCLVSVYLIPLIQHNTENLRGVSLLDARPPSNREDVVILGGVAVICESLLHEREANKRVRIIQLQKMYC